MKNIKKVNKNTKEYLEMKKKQGLYGINFLTKRKKK